MTVEQDIEQAKATYATHVIVDRGPDRWRIRKADGCSNFWTEIIIGAAGTVIVHGDGPDLILRSWKNSESGRNLLRWVASSNLDYLAGSVACGKDRVYDAELARQYARELADQYIEDYGSTDATAKKLLDLVENPSTPWDDGVEIRVRLWDIDAELELEGLGLRPSWDLISAQAACARLTELLDDEDTQLSSVADEVSRLVQERAILVAGLGAVGRMFSRKKLAFTCPVGGHDVEDLPDLEALAQAIKVCRNG